MDDNLQVLYSPPGNEPLSDGDSEAFKARLFMTVIMTIFIFGSVYIFVSKRNESLKREELEREMMAI